ncbi:MAG: hypothetical protein V4722_00170 [Bacteroidota bacterium]
MKTTIFFCMAFYISIAIQAQNVGIGTITPNSNALLHLDVGSGTKGFLFTGTFTNPSTVPDLGAGSRMMFFPGRAAFRAGYVSGTEWNTANTGYYSTALGNKTTASGSNSVAMGNSTIADGSNSFAAGLSSTAYGSYSTSFGYYNNANG